MTYSMPFYQLLDHSMGLNGHISCAELGRRSGVPAYAISMYRNGKRRPTPEDIRKLAVVVPQLRAMAGMPPACGA